VAHIRRSESHRLRLSDRRREQLRTSLWVVHVRRRYDAVVTGEIERETVLRLDDA
jgi:hypothetical protein